MTLIKKLSIILVLLCSSSTAWAEWTIETNPCEGSAPDGYVGYCIMTVYSEEVGQWQFEPYAYLYNTNEEATSEITMEANVTGDNAWAISASLIWDPYYGTFACHAGLSVSEQEGIAYDPDPGNFCNNNGLAPPWTESWANVIMFSPSGEFRYRAEN